MSMQELKCPKCSQNFVTEKVAGIVVKTCRKCSTVFVDGMEILRLREGPAVLDAGSAKKSLEMRQITDKNYVSEKCPHCGVSLHDEEYIRDSGIHFKLCAKCSSIMFEPEDLTRLKQYQVKLDTRIHEEFEELFPVMKRMMAK